MVASLTISLSGLQCVSHSLCHSFVGPFSHAPVSIGHCAACCKHSWKQGAHGFSLHGVAQKTLIRNANTVRCELSAGNTRIYMNAEHRNPTFYLLSITNLYWFCLLDTSWILAFVPHPQHLTFLQLFPNLSPCPHFSCPQPSLPLPTARFFKN